MLKYRLPIGLSLIAALLLVLWADETWTGSPLPEDLGGYTLPRGTIIFVVMLPITFMAARELARIMREKQIMAGTGITCLSALVGLMLSFFGPQVLSPARAHEAAATAAVLMLLTSLAYYSRHKNTQGVVAAAGGTLLAFVYLGLMFGFVLAIRREHSAWLLAWVLLVTKMSDTGAYFLGRAVGRHKMIPWLSPGKTWEGLAGGALFASATAAGGLWILAQALPNESLPSPASGLVVGVLAAGFGQAGDLIMSLFKRDAGRKDSGHSVPGFGGVLDILDSPLLVTPLAYWWLCLTA